MLSYQISSQYDFADFFTYLEYQNSGILSGVAIFRNEDKTHQQEQCALSFYKSGVTGCLLIQQTSKTVSPFVGTVSFAMPNSKPVLMGHLNLKEN